MCVRILKSVQEIIMKRLGNRVSSAEIEEVLQEVSAHIKTSYVPMHDDEGSLVWTAASDIIYYTKTKNSVTFHTFETEFQSASCKHLELEDFILTDDFFMADKSTVVNTKLVKAYDTNLGRLYFGDYQNNEHKSIQVTIKAAKEFKSILGQEYDVAGKMNVEYSKLESRSKRKGVFA